MNYYKSEKPKVSIIYPHQSNIETKIDNNYNNAKEHIRRFKFDIYLPMRKNIKSLHISSDKGTFKEAVNILNQYSIDLHNFALANKISSQSKFESSFLEEISCYLFSELPAIQKGILGIFNKGIYAGLKIKNDYSVDITTKDVDFCIGRIVDILIDRVPNKLIIPVVCVEVKTYLDATMFGEIKSSSKDLKSANPDSHEYVLMGYRDLKDEHIRAAKQDSALEELFVLQAEKKYPIQIDPNALYDYYSEIVDVIGSIGNISRMGKTGRMFEPNSIDFL